MSIEEHRESAVPTLGFPRQTLVSLLVFAVFWETLSHLAPHLGIPPFAIPGFVKIARSIADVTPIDIVVTLARVIAALIASFVLGLSLAMAMYRSQALDDYLHPMIRILMAVPVVSWILFAVLWFPGVEFRIGFVLVVVCGPVFLIDTLDAMRSVPRELRHMMQSFRPTTLQYFRKLILPAIVPTIFTSWKVNISLAIRVVTIAELVGAVTGIGHQLSVAEELFSVSDVFAWTVILVVLLFMLEAMVARVEARLLRWRA
jgi:NitT/TauT family transport system permease protein